MYLTFADADSDRHTEQLASGVRRSWIATEEFGGSRAAQVSVITISPSTTYWFVSEDGRERICVLVEGSADLLIQNETMLINEGAVIHSKTGSPFTIRTTESIAHLLVLSESTPGATSTGDRQPEAVDVVSPVECFSLYDVKDEVLHEPQTGFFNMGTRMLLNADKGGYQFFIFGQSSFAQANGVHAVHRHPATDEVFYVWEGEGAHLDGDGKQHPMRRGDAVFVPRNEWHGFRNIGDRSVRAFFCLIGTGVMQRAGNEVLRNDSAVNAFSVPPREEPDRPG